MTADLLTSNEAASFLRLSTRMMALHRAKGTGPAFVRIGARRIAYRRADIEAWLASRTSLPIAA